MRFQTGESKNKFHDRTASKAIELIYYFFFFFSFPVLKVYTGHDTVVFR